MKDEKIELNPCGNCKMPARVSDKPAHLVLIDCPTCERFSLGATMDSTASDWNRLNPPAQPALKEMNSQNNPPTPEPTEAERLNLAEQLEKRFQPFPSLGALFRDIARFILTLRATDQATIASQAERISEFDRKYKADSKMVEELVERLDGELDAARADIKRKDELLDTIYNICTGESQVADDDTDALDYIAKAIKPAPAQQVVEYAECFICNGTGRDIGSQLCMTCAGTGQLEKEETAPHPAPAEEVKGPRCSYCGESPHQIKDCPACQNPETTTFMLLETRKQISSLRAQLDGLVKALNIARPHVLKAGAFGNVELSIIQIDKALSAIKNEAKKGK